MKLAKTLTITALGAILATAGSLSAAPPQQSQRYAYSQGRAGQGYTGQGYAGQSYAGQGYGERYGEGFVERGRALIRQGERLERMGYFRRGEELEREGRALIRRGEERERFSERRDWR